MNRVRPFLLFTAFSFANWVIPIHQQLSPLRDLLEHKLIRARAAMMICRVP